MREIKFRAWDIENKDMVYPTIGDLATINNKKFVIQRENFGSVTMVELMQFTGLVDKNDVEIFERDIIDCVTFDNADQLVKGEVFYDDKRNGYCVRIVGGTAIDKYPLYAIVTCEVIGNIYENSDLLSTV